MLPSASWRAADSSRRARCWAAVPFTSAVKFSFCCCMFAILEAGGEDGGMGRRIKRCSKHCKCIWDFLFARRPSKSKNSEARKHKSCKSVSDG